MATNNNLKLYLVNKHQNKEQVLNEKKATPKHIHHMKQNSLYYAKSETDLTKNFDNEVNSTNKKQIFNFFLLKNYFFSVV